MPINILLFQFRESEKIALHEKNCVLKRIRKTDNLKVVNVFKDDFVFSKKNLKDYDKIILGGCGEFSLSERKNKKQLWKKTQKIKPIIKYNIPTLGICFGHQIIAFFLGSKITSNKSEKEIGSYKVSLTEEGRNNIIFKNIPDHFTVQQGHKDCLKKLPQKFTLLAKSAVCEIQSFKYKNFYGVQFHPEMKKEDILFRLNLSSDYKKENNIEESPLTSKIIKNFLYEL